MRYARLASTDGGKKKDVVLAAGKHASITPAYSRSVVANRKIDVPQNVSNRMVKEATQVLRVRLNEELDKGGIDIKLKEARILEQDEGLEKNVRKAQFGFEVDIVSPTNETKTFGALVEYDSNHPKSKQYSVADSVLLPGEKKVGFTRKAITDFLTAKEERPVLAVFFDPDIKRYRCLGQATEEVVEGLKKSGHFIRKRYLDKSILANHEGPGYEVIPTIERVAEMQKMAAGWEDRSLEKNKNVPESELLPTIPTPNQKEPWEDRSLEKSPNMTDEQMLKLEKKKKGQFEGLEDEDEKEDEEETETEETETEETDEMEEESEELAESAGGAAEEIVEELAGEDEVSDEVIDEAASAVEEKVKQTVDQVADTLEEVVEDIKDDVRSEIQDEVKEEAIEQAKETLKEEVMDAIDTTTPIEPMEKEVEVDIEANPYEEMGEYSEEETYPLTEEEFNIVASLRQMKQKKAQAVPEPVVEEPVVEEATEFPTRFELLVTRPDGTKVSVPYVRETDGYRREPTPDLPGIEGIPEVIPTTAVPTVARKKKRK